MGFLSRLLDMPSFNGATNALLVELALPELTESQSSQLKGRVLNYSERTALQMGRWKSISRAEPNTAHSFS